MYMCRVFFVFFCKQKTAYEMRISDWSSDVCSSDLAVEPSGQPLLDIAVAAEAFHGLSAERRRQLADPILGDRRHHAAPGGLGLAARGAVEGSGEAEGKRRRRLHVERHIGQHRRPERLVDEVLLEHPAGAAMMQRTRKGEAHPPGRGEGPVEPSQGPPLPDVVNDRT